LTKEILCVGLNYTDVIGGRLDTHLILIGRTKSAPVYGIPDLSTTQSLLCLWPDSIQHYCSSMKISIYCWFPPNQNTSGFVLAIGFDIWTFRILLQQYARHGALIVAGHLCYNLKLLSELRYGEKSYADLTD
jgi:hypothetical protein